MNKLFIQSILLLLICMSFRNVSLADGGQHCIDSTWTECNSVSAMTAGYFIYNGMPITEICMPLINAPYGLWDYLSDTRFLSITNSHCRYIYTEHHRDAACNETSSVFTANYDVNAIFPTNPIVSTLAPGTYNLVAEWTTPNCYCTVDPAWATLVVNVYQMGTTFTAIPDTPITPGSIGGSTYDNGTVFFLKSTTNLSIYSFMTLENITVSDGSDNDKRINFITQGPCSTSTSTTDIADTVCTSTTGDLDLTTPGIYEITVTFYDLATAAGTVHDASTTKKFYVCVYWVDLEMKTSGTLDSDDPLNFIYGNYTSRDLGPVNLTNLLGLGDYKSQVEFIGTIVPAIATTLNFSFLQDSRSYFWENGILSSITGSTSWHADIINSDNTWNTPINAKIFHIDSPGLTNVKRGEAAGDSKEVKQDMNTYIFQIPTDFIKWYNHIQISWDAKEDVWDVNDWSLGEGNILP